MNCGCSGSSTMEVSATITSSSILALDTIYPYDTTSGSLELTMPSNPAPGQKIAIANVGGSTKSVYFVSDYMMEDPNVPGNYTPPLIFGGAGAEGAYIEWFFTGTVWKIASMNYRKYDPRYIGNLSIDYLTANTVRINTGNARAGNDRWNLDYAATVTMNLNSSGANGLDTGVRTADNWYYVLAMTEQYEGANAGLFTLKDPTSGDPTPTFPVGTWQRRALPPVYNRLGNTIRPFFCQGFGVSVDVFWTDGIAGDQILVDGAVQTTFTTVDLTKWVPSGSRWVYLFVSVKNGSVIIEDPSIGGNGTVFHAASSNGGTENAYTTFMAKLHIGPSRTVRYKLLDDFGTAGIRIVAAGFIWER